MPAWLEIFLVSFIPLLVALDPVGLVPIFLGMASGVPEKERGQVVIKAVGTAALVATGFLFLGKFILHALGISVSDFKIAGGLILLGLAAEDILRPRPKESLAISDFGVVPLGMPIIAGPAVLTTLLALTDSVGIGMTLLSLGLNLGLVFAALFYSKLLQRMVGATTMRAVSKMVALLLAAIAVSMIRHGLAS